MSSEPTQIGIAVVEHEGRYLVGTRGSDVPLDGYDELGSYFDGFMLPQSKDDARRTAA